MASSFVIAKRYTKALMGLCNGVEGAKAIAGPLAGIATAIQESSELSGLLASPAFAIDQKWNVLRALGEKFNSPEIFVKFLKVLAESDRASVILEINEQFKTQVLEMESSIEATIESAFTLSDAHLAQITALLTKSFGKKVTLIQSVIPQLIAGVRISVQGRTLDSSFVSNLEQVHRDLLQAQA